MQMLIFAPGVTVSGRFPQNCLCHIKVFKCWQFLDSFVYCPHFRRHRSEDYKDRCTAKETFCLTPPYEKNQLHQLLSAGCRAAHSFSPAPTTCAEPAVKYRRVLAEPQTRICTALLEYCWVPGQREYLILKCCISALSLKVSRYLQSAWGMWQHCTWFLVLLGMAHFLAQSPQSPWKGSSNAWQWFVCTTHIWQPFFVVLHLQRSYRYPSS